MDWFKGKVTGNHRFYHQISGFPVKIFPSSSSKGVQFSIIQLQETIDFTIIPYQFSIVFSMSSESNSRTELPKRSRGSNVSKNQWRHHLS